MKTRRVMLALGAVLACGSLMAGGAWAQEDYARTGIYAGLGGMYSLEMFSSEYTDFLGDVGDIDDSFGIDARVGYRIHPHFAVEIEVLYNFGWTFKTFGIDVMEASHLAILPNAKVYVLKGRFQPYATVGGGYSYGTLEDVTGLTGWDDSLSDFCLKFGGGLDAYVLPQLAVFVEVSYLISGFDDLEDLNFLPIMGGVAYRF